MRKMKIKPIVVKVSVLFLMACAYAFSFVVDNVSVTILVAALMVMVIHPLVEYGNESYYFVTFISKGISGRVFLKFSEPVPVSRMEEEIQRILDGGDDVTVILYKSVSKKEYELNL